jgi:hypothetical protein
VRTHADIGLGADLMSRRKQVSSPAPADTATATHPLKAFGKLKQVGGSRSDDWNLQIIDDTRQALWLTNSNANTRDQQVKAALVGLISVGPKDELEGMMAAQLVAAHSATMECYRRAMIGEQTFEGRRENLTHANKLSRTFAVLLDALNRHRGKGQQKVVVEHVHVHAGGQAVVGAIAAPGGGDRAKSEEQPHAKQIGHALEPAMRSADPQRQSMPIASHAERPMPNARRPFAGSTEG